MKTHPTKKQLHTFFNYENGNLFWKKSKGRGVAGQVAGTKNNTERILIRINSDGFLAHRLIWIYHNGPTNFCIDHKNQDPNDNRIENLRLATKGENNCFRGARRDNVIGLKGVSRERNGGFRARIQIRGIRKFLGIFSTSELAAKAYNRAAKKYHGEFACLNDI